MMRTALIELSDDADVNMKDTRYQDVILSGGRGYLMSEQGFERWFALNNKYNEYEFPDERPSNQPLYILDLIFDEIMYDEDRGKLYRIRYGNRVRIQPEPDKIPIGRITFIPWGEQFIQQSLSC